MKAILLPAIAAFAALSLSSCRTTNNYTIIEPLPAPKTSTPSKKVVTPKVRYEQPLTGFGFSATSPNNSTTNPFNSKTATNSDAGKPAAGFEATAPSR